MHGSRYAWKEPLLFSPQRRGQILDRKCSSCTGHSRKVWTVARARWNVNRISTVRLLYIPIAANISLTPRRLIRAVNSSSFTYVRTAKATQQRRYTPVSWQAICKDMMCTRCSLSSMAFGNFWSCLRVLIHSALEPQTADVTSRGDDRIVEPPKQWAKGSGKL